MFSDRGGSIAGRKTSGGTERNYYYPWGEERSATANEREKFGTYFRDGNGIDYADQRYYQSQYGRFMTADPYKASAGVESPGSWNRYAYVEGDPVNRYDPTGRDWEDVVNFMNCVNTGFCPGVTWGDMGIGTDGGCHPADTRCNGGGQQNVAGGDTDRERKFRRDMEGARRNHNSVKDAIRGAVPAGGVFSAEMIDCMAGLESTWNPMSDGPGTRTGLFQYDQAGWEGDTDLPYSTQNVQNIAMSVATAISGLTWRYNKSVEKQPGRTAEEHLMRAFSLFNGEENKYGEYGYGRAILDCAKGMASSFEEGFRAIWNLTNP
jgi:RHS repeat-associated protein